MLHYLESHSCCSEVLALSFCCSADAPSPCIPATCTICSLPCCTWLFFSSLSSSQILVATTSPPSPPSLPSAPSSASPPSPSSAPSSSLTTSSATSSIVASSTSAASSSAISSTSSSSSLPPPPVASSPSYVLLSIGHQEKHDLIVVYSVHSVATIPALITQPITINYNFVTTSSSAVNGTAGGSLTIQGNLSVSSSTELLVIFSNLTPLVSVVSGTTFIHVC